MNLPLAKGGGDYMDFRSDEWCESTMTKERRFSRPALRMANAVASLDD